MLLVKNIFILILGVVVLYLKGFFDVCLRSRYFNVSYYIVGFLKDIYSKFFLWVSIN